MLSKEMIYYLGLKLETSGLMNEILASSGGTAVAAVYVCSTAPNAKVTKTAQIKNTQQDKETKPPNLTLTAERAR